MHLRILVTLLLFTLFVACSSSQKTVTAPVLKTDIAYCEGINEQEAWPAPAVEGCVYLDRHRKGPRWFFEKDGNRKILLDDRLGALLGAKVEQAFVDDSGRYLAIQYKAVGQKNYRRWIEVVSLPRLVRFNQYFIRATIPLADKSMRVKGWDADGMKIQSKRALSIRKTWNPRETNIHLKPKLGSDASDELRLYTFVLRPAPALRRLN